MPVWFTACWLFAPGKDGVSALSLKRTLEVGSYQTAWAILHRLRSVLVRPGRERLAGTVEVDETSIGGEEPGLRGGRARGKKVLTSVAVESRDPNGIGRCRMLPLADGSAASLHAFVTNHVEPGARVITDGWRGYLGLDQLGYVHDRRRQREDPDDLLPAVHRVASLAKRWLLGTHQGSVGDAHLAAPSRSSCSGSIAVAPAAAGWCSIGSLKARLPMTRCVTWTSSSARGLGPCHLHRRAPAGTRRAWSALRRTAHGEQWARVTPVKWIPPSELMKRTT